MDTEINKFAQISDIYSQFTEKNKNNLIRTAKSLLKIQHTSEAMAVSALDGKAAQMHGEKRSFT